MSSESRGWRNLGIIHRTLEVVATVAVIVAAALVMYQTLRRPPAAAAREIVIPREPLVVEGAVRGDPAASAIMLVYSDFECPFCGRFAREVLPQLEAEYGATGKARFVFRHFPLRKHSFARQAAVAAVCAGRQGKFWEMHDRLFAQGAELDEPELARRAAEIRLDPSQFTKCLSADSSSEIVDRDVTSASASGVMSTPTFFFGIEEPDGRVRVKSAMSGARPIGEFRTRLDDLLSSRALPAATSR